MGFLMDYGNTNTPLSNLNSARSLRKDLVGYQISENQFYFEDKNYSSSWYQMSFPKLYSYRLRNINEKYLELKLVLKKAPITYSLVFFLIFNLIFILVSIFLPKDEMFMILIPIIITSIFLLAGFLGMLIYLSLTKIHSDED